MILDTRVSVVIPVGPEKYHQKYLEECVASVRAQTHPANEILLIDDMTDLTTITDTTTMQMGNNWHVGVETAINGFLEGCNIWRSPWRLGVASAINCGVSLAVNDLVYLLCADDWLEPECLAACVEEYERRKDLLGYYHVTVRFAIEAGHQHPFPLPDPPIQDLPCGSAMVTKQLWRCTGGFPLESGFSPDAVFISILLGNPGNGSLRPVKQGVPLCNLRLHAEQDSASRSPWVGVVGTVRDMMTREWKQPTWGRFDG